jgi:hypothetical protein
MRQTVIRSTICLAIGLALLLVAGNLDPNHTTQAWAGGLRHAATGELFQNQYVPPVEPKGVGATLYPCPRPTPPLVGHTYITYEPLMPEQFLYRHHQVYRTNNADGARSRTSVHWR